MPVQKFSVCLDRPDHTGHRILALEQPPGFRFETRPGTREKFAQQLAIEAGMHAKALGNGEDDLPMRDGKTDLFADVQGSQKSPFLMAGGTRTALLAGEGDKHLMLAVGTANAGEACLQIAALEIG